MFLISLTLGYEELIQYVILITFQIIQALWLRYVNVKGRTGSLRWQCIAHYYYY